MHWYDRTPEEVVKTVVLDTGTKVSFKKNPPYGHWTIHYEHGEMAPSLKGFFTSYELAKRSFDNYLANKTQRKTEIVQEPECPVPPATPSKTPSRKGSSPKQAA